MADINTVVRGSGATRRQVDDWTRRGLLLAALIGNRYDFEPAEIDIARALARMSDQGIGPSSKLAHTVCFALRLGNRTKISEAWATIDLKALVGQ